jgi:predicted O-methyltransferase YrrM
LEIGIHKAGLFNKASRFTQESVGIDVDPTCRQSMKLRKQDRFICGDSASEMKKLILEDRKFDFIFIDGNHSKQAVMTDFSLAIELIRLDGIVMLHDTYPENEHATASDRCDDGYLAVEEASKLAEEWEMMTIPIHPGLTICRKRNRQVSWS